MDDADSADRPDADLGDRLAGDHRPRTVTTLPDGSLDAYYDAYGDRAERIASAADFGERVGSDTDSIRLSRTAREPGGQAVVMARQARALGDRVTLFGHLDNPAFDALDVETRSMGEPSAVRVLEFDDDELVLADTSPDVADWGLDDLERVADDSDAALTAEAVCWGNWISVEGMSEAFRTLADRSLDGGWLLLDPGDVAAADPERVRTLADSLAALADAYDVVVSANRRELAAAIEAFDRPVRPGDDAEIVTAVRDRASATAVVMHEERAAVAATPAGVRRVPNYEVREANRPTGAGDCFTAALAHALVRDWNWPTALGVANLAAAHRVETGRVGDRASLRGFLRDHDAKALE